MVLLKNVNILKDLTIELYNFINSFILLLLNLLQINSFLLNLVIILLFRYELNNRITNIT